MSNLVEEFFEEVKEKYPEVSINHMKHICNAPFKLLKKEITEANHRDIRFKHFGLFKFCHKRIPYMLKKLEDNYKKGLISEERYLKRKEIYTKNEQV